MSIATLITGGLGSFGNIATLLTDGLASYTGLPQPPATGYQYLTCTTAPYTGSGVSIEQGSSPAVVVGDVFIAALASSPSSFAVSVNGDGTVDLNAGGNTSRQLVLYAIYRVLSNAIDPPTFPAVTGELWINEIAPVWNAPVNLSLTISVPINVSLPTYASSSEGDTLVFTLNSGSLPPGITIGSGNSLIGTPTTDGTYTFTLLATDITGTGTASSSSQIVVSAAPVVYPTILATVEALTAAGVNVNPTYVYAYSSSVPNGYVISISPAPGSVISPGSTCQLTVSLGPANPTQVTAIPNVVGMPIEQAMLTLVQASCSVGPITYTNLPQGSGTFRGHVYTQTPVAVGGVSLWTQVSLVVNAGPLQTYPNTSSPTVPSLP